MLSFEFGGKDSFNDYRIVIEKRPTISSPKRRVNYIDIPGKSSSVRHDENTYEDITILLECALKSKDNIVSKIDEIKAWLFTTGESDLIFSFQPDKKYIAQVVNAIDFTQIFKYTSKFPILFNCRPFKYSVQNIPLTVHESGTNIINPGTIESLPIIKIYGGELIRDNFTIEILEKLGEDKGTTIRYGKNIKGLKAIIDTSEFATRIYPIGDNNIVLQERYLEAEGEIANILPYPITRKVEFSGCKDVEELRELAKKYIKKVSNPFINITVELLELSRTKEYGKYAKLFNMELGDIVKVEHERLGIYSELRVIKKVTDLLNHINTKIELGNPLNTIINKLDFNSVVKSLESRIEGAQNAVILKKNTDAMSILSMSFYQTIAVAISALADTNLSCSLTVSGVASDDLTLNMRFSLDGEYYEFQPSQNLAKGDNVISITIPIPQVTAGQHAFVIEIQTSNGTFHIDKNNLQVFIEGRHLEGGLNPSLPRAEVMQAVLYVIYSNKIKNYKDSIVTSEDITHLEDRVAIHFQEITYSEAINKGPKTMNTKTTISMKVAGFSHIADKIFYLNLNTDDWVMHFSEFKNIGSNNWILDHYITLTEKNDITKSSMYSYLGDGIVYEVNFGSRDEYKDIIEISSGLKEIEA